jgi:hypothetical protein
MSEFYSQKKKKKDGTEYTYYNPECKECTKQRSYKWAEDNPERRSYLKSKYDKGHDYIQQMKREWNIKNVQSGRYKMWQQENKDKLNEYNRKRREHKTHDITDQEWFECLDYFNNSCAYCGLSEQEQFNLYGEQFHKEHVIHTGSNYIDNCIPACTKCNCSKHNNEFNDWYNEDNSNFTPERLHKIVKWMTEDCFNTLNLL